MNLLPIARQSDVLVQDCDKELLIYNLKTNRVFSLNETSKNVYQSCNGEISFEELKQKYNYSDDLIFLALDELKKNDLIDDSYQPNFNGKSRREAIRRIGLSSIIALPLISSMLAPSGLQAASIPLTTCLPIGECIPLNTNYCSICSGRTISYTIHGLDSTCMSPDSSAIITCGTFAPSNVYFVINSIT